MNLTQKAEEIIRTHLENNGASAFDIVSSGMTPWDHDVCAVVTVSYRSRGSFRYEVWEVAFTCDGAWEGEGTFGLVAQNDVGSPKVLHEFQTFEYDLAIRQEVS